MTKKPITVAKSETLSIRLDPKTRFILEYIARLNGQTITTVVERSVIAAANSERVFDGRRWSDFWHVNEGIRALQIAEVAEFFPTYDEERRLSFAQTHRPFFYASDGINGFHQIYLEVLWPRIDEFIEFHEANKAKDWFAAGALLQQALRDANLEAPEWPINGSPKEAAVQQGDIS